MIFGAGRPRSPRQPRAARREGDDHVPPQLMPSLRALFSTAGSLLHTRLALAGVELEEEVQRFLTGAALGIAALVAVQLALIVLTFTVIFAVPSEYRLLTMVAITVLYLVAAAVAVAKLRAIFANRPPIFAGTLAEIEKDRETLASVNRAHREASEAREREARVRSEIQPAQTSAPSRVPEGAL